MNKTITVLFLAANPVDLPYRLRLDEEFREISKKVRVGRYRDSVEFACEWSVRVSDLPQALLDHCPHVVHFSGHGTKTDGIVLEDDSGNARPVNKQALARLFKVLKDNIRLVILNACYAEDQAKWLTEIVDYVIGMSDTVRDDAAITFSAYFYQSLAYGRTVRESFELALTQLELSAIDGSQVPRLLVRPGVDESVPLVKAVRTPVDAEANATSRQDLELEEVNSRIVDLSNLDGVTDPALSNATQHVKVRRVESDQFTITNVKNR